MSRPWSGRILIAIALKSEYDQIPIVIQSESNRDRTMQTPAGVQTVAMRPKHGCHKDESRTSTRESVVQLIIFLLYECIKKNCEYSYIHFVLALMTQFDLKFNLWFKKQMIWAISFFIVQKVRPPI